MAEGRLTLPQARKLCAEMDIKEPSSEAMRSALKVLGAAYEERDNEVALRGTIINKIFSQLRTSKSENRKLDKELKASKQARRMLDRTIQQGIAQEGVEKEKKEKFVEVRGYAQSIVQMTDTFEKDLKE